MTSKTRPRRRAASATQQGPSTQILDSRRLLYFYYVAKTGRFVGAEAALGVAQSAMSRQIQQLESELGLQLLERTGHGVTLTPFGEILYRDAEDILQRMSSTITELRDAASRNAQSVSIAAPPTFTNVYMADIILRLQARHPTLRVRAVEASSGSVMNQLTGGEVDCAIVSLANPPRRIVQRPLLTEPVTVICSPSHPVAKQKDVPRSQLHELDLVLPAALNGSRALLREYFSVEDVPLRSLIEADSLALSRQLVMQRRLCTILPTSSCEEQIAAGDLVAVALNPPLARTLYIARLRDHSPADAVRVLMDVTEEVVQRKQGRTRRPGKRSR
ncbi:LysR family transcriptional regulator [Panacagrimonas perspica]|nr:LysR family transcriptional regulator [Panacagrimonas perspica]